MSPWPKGGGGESDVQIAHSFFAHRDIRKDNQNCIEQQQTVVVVDLVVVVLVAKVAIIITPFMPLPELQGLNFLHQ